MKYLCIVFVDEEKLDAMPEADLRALDRESAAYDEHLRNKGHLLAAQALQPVRNARTVRLRDGKVSFTDGPFAETREQVGGFILIEAADLDEAVQLAANVPPIRLGAIEVRPIKELNP